MPLPVASGSAWPAYFVNQLGGEHNVGLVGTSLNCWTATQETHLQSMFLATHRAGLEDVIERGELLRCMESHGDAVFGGEIPLSQAFIAANYSLRTQLRAFTRTEPPGGIVTPAAAVLLKLLPSLWSVLVCVALALLASVRMCVDPYSGL